MQLDGLGIKAVGKSNKLLAHIEDVDGDTFNDLVVKIEDEANSFPNGDSTATVTGSLLDGTDFQGTDSICIVRPAMITVQ